MNLVLDTELTVSPHIQVEYTVLGNMVLVLIRELRNGI